MRIEDFPLSWRWTQNSHAKFPLSMLQTLIPIDPALAYVWYKRGLSIFQQPSAGERRYSSVDEQKARDWLLSINVPSESSVTIVWNSDLGISLPWGVFAHCWSDFCYPISDDAFIFLPDSLGVILYEHYEVFRHAPLPLNGFSESNG